MSTVENETRLLCPQVVVLMGPVRSGKTHELLRHYRSALEDASRTHFDRAIWLAPNSRTAAAVRQQLVAGGLQACLRPGVLTFDDLTTQIIAATNSRLKFVDAVSERELIRGVIRRALADGALKFFADAARRSGFVDLLVVHIAELKRRDIGPQAYAETVSRRPRAEQHSELVRLYANYEMLLASHQLVDHESAQSAARRALAENACRRFQQLELIVVDGFSDFTRTQLGILELLSRNAKQLLVSLPGDSDEDVLAATRQQERSAQPQRAPLRKASASRLTEVARRQDLFAKTAVTLGDLKDRFATLEIRPLAPRPLKCPAIGHLAEHIFRHPAHVPPPSAGVLDSLRRVEIVEAAGAHDEVVQVARRVKARLIASAAEPAARPGDIVVVFRSLGDVAPRVREVFAGFGIPFYVDVRPPVATAPVVKTIADLLALEEEDWPFRGVVNALTNNTIRAFEGEARRGAEWLVRELQIASGRANLLGRVEALAAESTTPIARSEYLQRRIDAAAAALPSLVRLAEALSGLPNETTLTQWCEALVSLGTSLGLAPFDKDCAAIQTGRLSERSDECQGDDLYAVDVAAWQSIVAKFAALERLDGWLGVPPRQFGRRELLAMLRDVAKTESLPRGHEEAGRVRILSAPSARNLSARHLFLAGMSELAFPSPEPPGRLATEAQYRQIEHSAHRSAAPQITGAPTRAQAEMLLFYEVLSRAEASLTISYPALDDKAQTLPPSPYVAELERILEIRRTRPQLSPVVLGEVPLNNSEWRTQAVGRAARTDGDRSLLAGLFACPQSKPLADAVDAGLRIVHARARGETFGPSEGWLTSAAARARLAHRFGGGHLWSASQWESYAACPYRFFLEDVLGLAPLGDLALEVDHRRRGSIVHDVLATFHRKLHDTPPEDWAALVRDEPRFVAQLQSTLQDIVQASGLSRDGIDLSLLELDRRQIEKWMARYREHYQKYDSAWTSLEEPMLPAHFELRFGQGRPGEASGEDPHSINDAFPLDIGDEQILVTGRIDRIDVGKVGGKQVFNVIDYKSGRRPTMTQEKIEAGECLQPALYVMAAQALVFDNDATPLWAGYWSMKNGVSTDKRFSLHCTIEGDSSWQKTQPKVIERIRAFVHAIRGGEFPVDSNDPDCTSRCDFNTICRVSQARSTGKIRSSENNS
jgi:ATP-dependent helicase/nuclease subunit B